MQRLLPCDNSNRDVEISMIKSCFKCTDNGEKADDKQACVLQCVTLMGINEINAFGDYAKEMYDLHQSI